MSADPHGMAGDVHVYHDDLPGYSEEQVWHDGCPTCEARGEIVAVWFLDSDNFLKAWFRARQWQDEGLKDMAKCEIGLFQVLNACRRQGMVLGKVPGGDSYSKRVLNG